MMLWKAQVVLSLSFAFFIQVSSNTERSVFDQVFEDDLILPPDVKYTSDDFIHIGVIMCNITLDPGKEFIDTKHGRQFKDMVRSLLKSSTGSKLHIIFLTDEKTKQFIKDVLINEMIIVLRASLIGPGSQINDFMSVFRGDTWKFPSLIRVEFVDINYFSTTFKSELDVMKKYYGAVGNEKTEVAADGKTYTFGRSTKYQKDLFFIGPFYHKAFPEELKWIILFDVDLNFRADLSELVEHRKSMSASELIGVGLELTPHYFALTTNYRILYPQSKVGAPGNYQGFNTGVVIYELEKLRKSEELNGMLNVDNYRLLVFTYLFFGTVGDQDLFTQMYWEKPELFYILPCEWNAQNHKDPTMKADIEEIYPLYHACPQEPKIIHDNKYIF